MKWVADAKVLCFITVARIHLGSKYFENEFWREDSFLNLFSWNFQWQSLAMSVALVTSRLINASGEASIVIAIYFYSYPFPQSHHPLVGLPFTVVSNRVNKLMEVGRAAA